MKNMRQIIQLGKTEVGQQVKPSLRITGDMLDVFGFTTGTSVKGEFTLDSEGDKICLTAEGRGLHTGVQPNGDLLTSITDCLSRDPLSRFRY